MFLWANGSTLITECWAFLLSMNKNLLKLNNKQKMFIAEYLKDKNATQAAIRAGYSKKTAGIQGFDLLNKPKIKECIEAELEKVRNLAIVDAAYVLKGLKRVHERCLKPEPVMTFDKEEKALVQVTDENGHLVYQFDSAGANRSLELLGKSLKLFTDKTEISADENLSDILKAGKRADE